MKQITEFNQKVRSSKKMPELRAGDIVRIHRKIKEGNKERVQVFEGIIIAIKAKQSSSPLLTVRRVSHGIGVEIVIPQYSPAIEKIEAVKRAKTRQAKLYYLRKKDFKLSKLKMKDLEQFASKEETLPAAEETEVLADEKQETEKQENSGEKNENVEAKQAVTEKKTEN